MQIAGKKVEGLSKVSVVLFRQDGNITIVAQGLPSYDEFNTICPAPKPPIRTYPDGRKEENRSDETFKKAVAEWAERKGNWTILKSLSATEGLKWDSVDMADPTTWKNYIKEMQESGLSDAEVTRIISAVMLANGLNQQMLNEAEKRFLATQVQGQ